MNSRRIWHERLPSGASIEYIGARDPDVTPDERKADERELVSLVSMNGYGMGIEPREFVEMMQAWLEHEDLPGIILRPDLGSPAEDLRSVSTETLREAWKATRRVLDKIEREGARR